jgi:prefoldin subunit 5
MSYQEESLRKNSYLEWWYRLTAPPEVASNASVAERERARRARLSSTILFVLLLSLFASLIGAILQSDRTLLFVLLPSFLVSIVVLALNRLGKVLTAGIILVSGFELGHIAGLVGNPHGLAASDLPGFDFLVESILLAVSFLPIKTVPWLALGNCIFIWAALTFLPHTADLGSLLATQAYSTIETPIALQVIIAFVTYLWVRSTNRAIARADRAEVVASLQQTIAQQKQQLDEGIQQILQTHVQVANGNFQARAPLMQDNSLWQIAVSLNNLLARLQRLGDSERALQQEKYELQKTRDALDQSKQEVARLSESIHKTRNGEPPEKLSSSHAPSFVKEDINARFDPSPSEKNAASSKLTREARPFHQWRMK